MSIEQGQRIKQRRELLGFSQEQLAQLVGCSQPAIRKMEGGANTRLIIEVASALKTTPEWLRNGGPAFTEHEEPMTYRTSQDNERPDITIRSHPRLEQNVAEYEIEISQYKGVGGAMGHGIILRDQPGEIHRLSVTAEWIDKNIRSHTGINNLAIVTGFGDSMKGMYNPGDPLLVDTGVKSVDFDGVYFFRVGNEGFIKRLQRIPGDGMLVISENKAYRDWTIKPEMDFEVFARVIKVWQGTDF